MTAAAKKWVLAILLLIAPAAHANRVLSVTSNGELVDITYEGPHRYRLNDTVCVYERGRKASCGTIARITGRQLQIKVTTQNYTVASGQTVDLRPDNRTIASEQSSDDAAVAHDEKFLDFALGIQTGFSYFQGMAQVNLAVSRSFSLGIEPLFSIEKHINSVGGFLNLTYYYTHFPFRGVIFNAGLGFYKIDFFPQYSTTPFAFQLTVGWRGKAHWGLNLDIGVTAGVQYVAQDSAYWNNTLAGTDNRLHGVLPVLNAYVGYSF